ncbi:MAG: L-serine ammonia-lyase [Caulobacteraceae bacterium]|nr:L-serine ammonia-lyase [Caulobacteraceae bacterium]
MISAFELFKIGIGPSSSHTVGPMKAAGRFAHTLADRGVKPARVTVTLFGSLAWTGIGHGTQRAVILGLAGEAPDTVDPDAADRLLADVEAHHWLIVVGHGVGFDPARDVIFDKDSETPVHPNTLAFTAYDASGAVLETQRWCSVGGGFITPENEVGAVFDDVLDAPHPFRSGAELLRRAEAASLTIAEMVLANECAIRPRAEVEQGLDRIIEAMMTCVERGMAAEGQLPGGLKVRRRAAALRSQIEVDETRNNRSPHEMMDRISLFAIAVNEENAAGGRVVTAPTNGAAGVVPAVMRYYRDTVPGASHAGLRTFLLAAAAIGGLFKMNASISGAEVGCQGEVGVACSMAAAGLAAAMGASNAQIENAAEIGMEHHLGMTCDPVGGLVQIPCIERNAMGAVKAVTAASLAMRGDGEHLVSLDKVIATMRQTGADMQSKYKETSLGGLAVSFIEC